MPDRRITALIQSVATRSAQETADLASALMRRSWPAAADGTDPVSREWLRRWSPAPAAAFTPDCGCAAGRCAWCN